VEQVVLDDADAALLTSVRGRYRATAAD
jgi:hypothetical protein